MGGVATAIPLCQDTRNRVGFDPDCGFQSPWLAGNDGLLSFCTPCPAPFIYTISRRAESQIQLFAFKAHSLNLYSAGSLGKIVISPLPPLQASLQHSQPQVAGVLLVSRSLPSGGRQQTINPFRLKFCGLNVFPTLAMSVISKGEVEQE